MSRGVAGRCGLSGLAVHNRSASPGPPLCIPVALLWPSSQSRQEAIEAWLPRVMMVREKNQGARYARPCVDSLTDAVTHEKQFSGRAPGL